MTGKMHVRHAAILTQSSDLIDFMLVSSFEMLQWLNFSIKGSEESDLHINSHQDWHEDLVRRFGQGDGGLSYTCSVMSDWGVMLLPMVGALASRASQETGQIQKFI